MEFIKTKQELSEKYGLRLKEPVITDIQPLSKYNSVINSSFQRELHSIEKLMKFNQMIIDGDLEDCPYIFSKKIMIF